MTKKQQQTYIAIAIIALVLIGLWWMKNKTATNNSATPAVGTKAKDESPLANGQSALSSWEGTLKASDNAKKGNLMLETKNQTIYIRTSRDFSSLIGKDVTVTYEGTAANFVLGDITLK